MEREGKNEQGIDAPPGAAGCSHFHERVPGFAMRAFDYIVIGAGSAGSIVAITMNSSASAALVIQSFRPVSS